jgi:DNA-binding CsgD family transcriptional regulator
MTERIYPGLSSTDDSACDFERGDASHLTTLVTSLATLTPVRFSPASAGHIPPLMVSPRQAAEANRGRDPQRTPKEATEADTPLAGLTETEFLVLLWVSEGKRNQEIATILGSSPRTVEKHVAKILKKLAVETRGAAARVLTDFHAAKRLAIPDARAMTKRVKYRRRSNRC